MNNFGTQSVFVLVLYTKPKHVLDRNSIGPGKVCCVRCSMYPDGRNVLVFIVYLLRLTAPGPPGPQAHPSRLCILSTWKALSSGEAHKAYSSLATDEEEGRGEQGYGEEEEALHHDHINNHQRNDRDGRHGLGYCSTSSPSLSASPAPGVSIESAGSTSNGNRKGYGYGYAAVQDEPDPGMGGNGGLRGEGRGGDDAVGPTPRPESGSGVGNEDFESPLAREGLVVPLSKAARRDDDGATMSIAREGVDMSASVAMEDGRRASSSLGYGGGSKNRDASGEGEIDQCKQQQQQLLDEKQEQEDRAFWTSRDGFRHTLVTAVFLGLSYAIAISLDDLGVILEVGVRVDVGDVTKATPGFPSFSSQ